MEKSNLYNHLQRLFDEGLGMKTTELEFGTLEVTVENRSQAKQITFFCKGYGGCQAESHRMAGWTNALELR